MKKILLGLLLSAFVLSGCSNSASERADRPADSAGSRGDIQCAEDEQDAGPADVPASRVVGLRVCESSATDYIAPAETLNDPERFVELLSKSEAIGSAGVPCEDLGRPTYSVEVLFENGQTRTVDFQRDEQGSCDQIRIGSDYWGTGGNLLIEELQSEFQDQFGVEFPPSR